MSISLLDHINSKNDETRAWVDAAPGRMAGYLTTNMSHWAEYGLTTPAEFDRYMTEEAFRNMYKDAYSVGYRGDLSAKTDEELDIAIRNMSDVVDITDYTIDEDQF